MSEYNNINADNINFGTHIGDVVITHYEAKAGSATQHIDQFGLELMQKVRGFWIDNVLEKSLQQGDIGLSAMPAPDAFYCFPELQKRDAIPDDLPARGLVELFDSHHGRLLVLGEPGSGKTTLMLQLVRTLIQRAKSEPERQFPLVVNLSSWSSLTVSRKELQEQQLTDYDRRQLNKLSQGLRGKYHLPVAEWIVKELVEEHGIDRDIARKWIVTGRLALFLDGFDEVLPEFRSKCLAEINRFENLYADNALVICSRTAEYKAVFNEVERGLHLNALVVVRPLTLEQAITYLDRIQAPHIVDLLNRESSARTLTASPFWLSTMVSAYRSFSRHEIGMLSDLLERKQHIIGHYILARCGFSPDDLSVLASKLVERGASVFYLDRLDNTLGDSFWGTLWNWDKIKKDVEENSNTFVRPFFDPTSVGSAVRKGVEVVKGNGDFKQINNMERLELLKLAIPIAQVAGTVGKSMIENTIEERRRVNRAREARKKAYIQLLDTMVEKGIMRRISHRYGNGYMFAHDTIRQYFAGNLGNASGA